MPRPLKSHENCRLLVCLLCFGKTKTMRSITPAMQTTIENHFLNGYNTDDIRLPTVLCNTCRLVVAEYEKGDFSRTINLFDYTMLHQLPPIATRSNPDCTCMLCDIASKGGWTQSKVGRPPANINRQSMNTAIKVCGKCLTELAKGKVHHCSDGTKLDNLKLLTSDKMSEQLASAVLLKKQASTATTSSNVLNLATSTGRPIRVEVSPPSPSTSSKILTTNDLSNIQVSMNLSTNATLKLSGLLRNSTNNRKCIEPDSKAKLAQINHSLDLFFGVTSMEFVTLDGNKAVCQQSEKVVIYCTDLDGLVSRIIEKRGYEFESDLIYKIGVDGGGGFFKLCLTISDADDEETLRNKHKDTGVKRIFIIGMVPNIQENYSNVLKMWAQLQLIGPQACSSMSSKVIATDLKLANILLGLMAHGSAHPCTWCDQHSSCLKCKGNLRTLGSITAMFWKWREETDGNPRQAKHFDNVVHLPILKGKPTDLVIDLLPPPELHLLLGPVNTHYFVLWRRCGLKQ